MKAIAILILFFCHSALASFTCENSFASEVPSARSFALSLGIDESRDIASKVLFNRYLKKWNPEQAYTQESFEKRIEQSYELIRQLQIHQGLTDNRTRDFSARPEELVEWAEKALLREGLKVYLLKHPSDISDANKFRFQVQRLLQTKSMKALWAAFTLKLPKRFDRPVPAALLTKISMDGLDAHIDELKSQYDFTTQNRVETYGRLRKALGYFVLTVNAILMFNQLEISEKQQMAEAERVHIEQTKQFNELNHQLDDLEAAIAAL